jgi:hypothetical protein
MAIVAMPRTVRSWAGGGLDACVPDGFEHGGGVNVSLRPMKQHPNAWQRMGSGRLIWGKMLIVSVFRRRS